MLSAGVNISLLRSALLGREAVLLVEISVNGSPPKLLVGNIQILYLSCAPTLHTKFEKKLNCGKKCSSDREFFEIQAEGREFAKILRSLKVGSEKINC